MSEEIKEKLDLFPNNMNDIAKEAYYQLENYITNLKQKVEQLENIRKEAIEYIKNNSYFESNIVKTMILGDYSSGLLNILNKGSDEI